MISDAPYDGSNPVFTHCSLYSLERTTAGDQKPEKGHVRANVQCYAIERCLSISIWRVTLQGVASPWKNTMCFMMALPQCGSSVTVVLLWNRETYGRKAGEKRSADGRRPFCHAAVSGIYFSALFTVLTGSRVC